MRGWPLHLGEIYSNVVPRETRESERESETKCEKLISSHPHVSYVARIIIFVHT